MRLIETISELKSWRKNANGTVGFVPTMGALHAGHAELLRRMHETSDIRVLSIFVNPTQFGPKEDFNQYPRTLESDLALAQECGVDVVFFPKAEELYPEGYSTYVEETELSQPLCGRFRPGHFRGVTTIVLKLFNIIQPQLAFFGLKDAQQFFVLKRMVKDLNLDIDLEGVPTVRESDGLAMSSRNRYLSPQAREKAPALFHELRKCADRIMHSRAHGEEDSKTAIEESRFALSAQGFDVQYFDFIKITKSTELLAVAAYLEGTRLIDNVILSQAMA